MKGSGFALTQEDVCSGVGVPTLKPERFMNTAQAEDPSAPFYKRVFLVFGLKLFPALASLVVLILFSRHLATEVYGHYQNFWVQVYLLSAFSALGLGSLVYSYTVAELRRFFSQLPWQTWLVAAGLVAGLALCFGWLQRPSLGMAMPMGFFLVYSMGIWGEILLSALRRFVQVSLLNFIYALLFLAVHLYWLRQGQQLDVLFEYLFLLQGLRLFGLVVCVIPGLSRVPLGGLEPPGEKIRLWAYLGVYELSGVLFRWLDKFLISIFLLQHQAAIYFNGAQGVPFLPLLLGAVAGASLMEMANHRGQREAIVETSKKASRLLACLVFPVFGFLVFYTPDLLVLILSEKYRQSIPIFYVGLAVMPLRAYSFTSILQHAQRGRIINLGSLGDLLLALLLAYPLYQSFGLPGVAAAFVISTYWQCGYYLWHAAQWARQPPAALIPWRDWLRKAALSLGVMTLAFGLDQWIFPQAAWPWWGMGLTALIVAWLYWKEVHRDPSLSLEVTTDKKG